MPTDQVRSLKYVGWTANCSFCQITIQRQGHSTRQTQHPPSFLKPSKNNPNERLESSILPQKQNLFRLVSSKGDSMKICRPVGDKVSTAPTGFSRHEQSARDNQNPVSQEILMGHTPAARKPAAIMRQQPVDIEFGFVSNLAVTTPLWQLCSDNSATDWLHETNEVMQ